MLRWNLAQRFHGCYFLFDEVDTMDTSRHIFFYYNPLDLMVAVVTRALGWQINIIMQRIFTFKDSITSFSEMYKLSSSSWKHFVEKQLKRVNLIPFILTGQTGTALTVKWYQYYSFSYFHITIFCYNLHANILFIFRISVYTFTFFVVS